MSTDVRLMFDSQFLFAVHLGGKPVTLTMREVKAGELIGEKGRKTKKPIVYFEGKQLGLALNRTNMKIVAGMYGFDTRAWIGKRVTLFPTTTQMAGQTVDCIRVKPTIPSDTGRSAPQSQQREPGDDT